MKKIKCITFDQEAQDALPDHIKAKMKADRAAEPDKYEKDLFLQNIIRSGSTTYFVKFYDDEKKLRVQADSFIKAGILAMAYIILRDGEGFDIEYVENLDCVKVPFSVV